ncbi:hypothetical protein [Stakelama pacifica]|uniref:hypothetical protein n=1 Tax=Stakelama pacifica TaxID=517720 RepID=UPI001060F52E|nr:hypothetical protein [Stakelama pacifica]GGP00721.1 hypothetical protein GCM10011329_37250 [Stakelama pacifica]
MADIKFTEGRLSFYFRDVVLAEKYDDWSHYRNQFCKFVKHSKAVDFLVVKDSEVWLIEVKDYRFHQRSKSIDISEEVSIKVRDTMAGLVSAKFLANMISELNSSHSALSCKKLRVALHLEQQKNPSRLFPLPVDPANLTIKLRQKLRFADHRVQIFNSRNFPPQLGEVTRF